MKRLELIIQAHEMILLAAELGQDVSQALGLHCLLSTISHIDLYFANATARSKANKRKVINRIALGVAPLIDANGIKRRGVSFQLTMDYISGQFFSVSRSNPSITFPLDIISLNCFLTCLLAATAALYTL